MTATGVPTRVTGRRPGLVRRLRRSVVAPSSRRRRTRAGAPNRFAAGQPTLLTVLTGAAVLYTAGAVELPSWFPAATATIWLMLGGFVLRLRYLLVYDVVVTLAVAVSVRLRE